MARGKRPGDLWQRLPASCGSQPALGLVDGPTALLSYQQCCSVCSVALATARPPGKSWVMQGFARHSSGAPHFCPPRQIEVVACKHGMWLWGELLKYLPGHRGASAEWCDTVWVGGWVGVYA
jgi:hypothetical protein